MLLLSVFFLKLFPFFFFFLEGEGNTYNNDWGQWYLQARIAWQSFFSSSNKQMTVCKITIIYSEYFKSAFHVWNAPDITCKDQCCYPQVSALLACPRKAQKTKLLRVLLPSRQETHLRLMNAERLVCTVPRLYANCSGSFGAPLAALRAFLGLQPPEYLGQRLFPQL